MDTPQARNAELCAEHQHAMRDFNAYTVLLQDTVARSAGINSVDLQVVGLLSSAGPATSGELAAHTGLSSGGAITSLIDRLERAGYVRRRRDAGDRRRVLVEAVSEKITSDVSPSYERIGRAWAQFLGTLSEEQIAFATEVLQAATAVNREEIERLRVATRRR